MSNRSDQQGAQRNAWYRSPQAWIAALAIAAIAVALTLDFALGYEQLARRVLYSALIAGGLPLVAMLARDLARGEFGSDMLAGISIVTAALLDEPLAGVLVVLMLSGGEAIEAYAVANASSALDALAKRMPTTARKRIDGETTEVPVEQLAPGDLVEVLPHQVCPVDGQVTQGRGAMDESYLTGEPYVISKAPGASVLSGAVNGESLLIVRATRKAADSRYAQIMRVMHESEQRRPRIRRLGDVLGGLYTPLALAIAAAAWAISGEPIRFLAVLVVATPCPLLIGIPVAIIGSISLAARRGIVVKDPAALERLPTCRTLIFDKTGTLTYGRPSVTEIIRPPNAPEEDELLALTAAVERYSKHPLAGAILRSAKDRGLDVPDAESVSEPPGQGLTGAVNGREVRVTSRAALPNEQLPPSETGLECAVIIDGAYAALIRFRDEPRSDTRAFIGHLGPHHRISRVMIVSGDRAEEVEHLAGRVGIADVRSEQSPEQKVQIVRDERSRAPTAFVGDGINDAPALAAATVGVAIGQSSEITGEAAGVVVLDSSLTAVDELVHIAARMRRIALQSAVGGMALSVVGMGFAAAGLLPPVAGAIAQEAIDVAAVLNALRAAFPPRSLSHIGRSTPPAKARAEHPQANSAPEQT